MVNFDIYQGTTVINTNNDQELNVGKPAAPLLHLISEFAKEDLHLPYEFCFDNLLTNMSLLACLKYLESGETGTIQRLVAGERLVAEIRFDIMNHFIEPVPGKKGRRRQGENRQTIGRTYSSFKNVTLVYVLSALQLIIATEQNLVLL